MVTEDTWCSKRAFRKHAHRIDDCGVGGQMCATRVGRCHPHSYPQERELVLLWQLEGYSTSTCDLEVSSKDCPEQAAVHSRVGASRVTVWMASDQDGDALT